MSGLTMPKKGDAARLLAELNAEHAPKPQDDSDPQGPPQETPTAINPSRQPDRTSEESNERYNVTTLQETFEDSNQRSNEVTGVSTHAVSNERSNGITGEPSQERRKASAQKGTKKSSNAVSNAPTNGSTKEGRNAVNNAISTVGTNDTTIVSASSEREERLQKAMQIAQGDELDVATIRVSAKLHAYLERYVERINRINPKAKYRKQDAIEAAFAAFYADHPMPPAPVEDEEL